MTFDLAMPTASGSIEGYIRSANSFPMLSQEEEIRLARRLRDKEDINSARQLVLSHLRVVVAVARGYKGYGLPQADLIQEGNVGLMKAVKRFDPERGIRLVSFAIHWIKAEINEFILRNWRLVKIAATKAQRKLFFNLRSLKQNLDTMGPNEADAIAKKLSVKTEEVIEMETRFNGRDISVEPISQDSDEACYNPIAYLTDGSEPSQILEAQENNHLNNKKLKQTLANLDPRSCRIIKARWLRGEKAVTLQKLAEELGVSAERIRQIEVKALQKMRVMMEPNL